MKLSFQKIKIVFISTLFLSLISYSSLLKLKQFPKDGKGQATQDQDFRQASIPPTITVMMDVPGYGIK